MKKLLVATALIGLSSMAMADNYYVQGDVGYARVKNEAGNVSGGDNTVSYGVSAGRALDSGARFAVDYTYLGDDEFNVKGTNLKQKVHSVGVSAIYDFKNDTNFTPYAGVRVSANRLSREGDGVSTHGTDAGVGAVVGVQYRVAPNVALDGAIEYNHLGKHEGIKREQYGIKTGVRVDF